MRINIHLIFLTFFCCACNCILQGQDFKMIGLLNKTDKRNICAKYTYTSNIGEAFTLTLYKNSTFLYETATDLVNNYSKGWWTFNKGVITLNSYFLSGVPIKVTYIDTIDKKQNQKIHIVKNINNELITSMFVYVNNDSTECSPLMNSCSREYDKIKRVKIKYENGLMSAWTEVLDINYNALSIIVLSKLNLSNFFLMKNVQFKKICNGLRLVNK